MPQKLPYIFVSSSKNFLRQVILAPFVYLRYKISQLSGLHSKVSKGVPSDDIRLPLPISSGSGVVVDDQQLRTIWKAPFPDSDRGKKSRRFTCKPPAVKPSPRVSSRSGMPSAYVRALIASADALTSRGRTSFQQYCYKTIICATVSSVCKW